MNPTVQNNLDSLLSEQAKDVVAMNESARKLGTFPTAAAIDQYNEQFEKSLSSDTKLLQLNEMPSHFLQGDSSFKDTQYSLSESTSSTKESKTSQYLKPKPVAPI